MGYYAKVRTIQDVAERHLCCGCGVCAYLAPEAIEMVDDLEQGRRPLVVKSAGHEASLQQALEACPGINLSHSFNPNSPEWISELLKTWGPIKRIYEGHAVDEEIRFAASSGGVASALGQYCIEKLGMHGVIHIAAREDIPYLNQTVISRSRGEILGRSGSRYAPASPCDGLKIAEDAPGPCVFIGKPCDIAAVTQACRMRPELAKKIGLTIAIFCFGTPSTGGTLKMTSSVGVGDPSQIKEIRYRGNGWPGDTVIKYNDGKGIASKSLTYLQAWGDILSYHCPWRCRLCPDHTGEFADLAVGDPWYRKIEPGEPGHSMILNRTDRGLEIYTAAMEDGYIEAEQADPSILPGSQEYLAKARGHVWARCLVCRLLGIPAPGFKGFPMFQEWLRLPLKEKIQSLAGTARRIIFRRLHRRRRIKPFVP